MAPRPRAHSSSIGIIALVAVTLISSVTIGVVVFDEFDQLSPLNDRPQSALVATADATTNRITIHHKAGDRLDSAHIRIVVSNSTLTQTFEPINSTTYLSAGSHATVELTRVDGNNRVDWNPQTHGWEYNESGAFDGIVSDDRFTVTFVDTRSQLKVFETTITATGGSQTGSTGMTLALSADATQDEIYLNYEEGPGLNSDEIAVHVVVDGAAYTFQPTSSNTSLSPGEVAVISTTAPSGVDAGPDKIEWDPDTSGVEYDSAPNNALPAIDAKVSIRVRLTNTHTGEVVFDNTTTAE